MLTGCVAYLFPLICFQLSVSLYLKCISFRSILIISAFSPLPCNVTIDVCELGILFPYLLFIHLNHVLLCSFSAAARPNYCQGLGAWGLHLLAVCGLGASLCSQRLPTFLLRPSTWPLQQQYVTFLSAFESLNLSNFSAAGPRFQLEKGLCL